MIIDIYFDTICPWCMIGKKRLFAALDAMSQPPLTLQWKPFLLNPTMGDQGIDRQLYLEQKFGGPERARRIYDIIARTGYEDGIPFQFDKIQRTPNSIPSHRLVAFAQEIGKVDEMVDRLFLAFFMEGQDIGQIDVLVDLAVDVGLEKNAVVDLFNSDRFLHDVVETDAKARNLGITGVPAYIARDRYILSGAQDATILQKFIEASAQG